MKYISLASLVVLNSHINRHIPAGSQSLGIIVTMKRDQSKHYLPGSLCCTPFDGMLDTAAPWIFKNNSQLM